MATVRLLGELGKRYGRTHNFDVRNPGEAVRALCANFPGFDAHLVRSHERNVGYKVTVGKDAVDLDEVHNPSGRQTITIAPVIMGSGKVFKIVLGVALIAASFFLPTAPLFTLGSFAPSFASIAFGIGVNLVLGGVAQLLSPTPTAPSYADREETDKPSYMFNGPVNTTVQGLAVPVGYGRMVVGSAIISAGVDVDQITA